MRWRTSPPSSTTRRGTRSSPATGRGSCTCGATSLRREGRLALQRPCAHVSASHAQRRAEATTDRAPVLDDAVDEDVRHSLCVRVPVRPVLRLAPRLVPARPVDDHPREEDEVPVGHERPEAADEAPRERHYDVARVVRLAHVPIPAVHEQLAAPRGVDALGVVLQRAPRQLRERPPLHESAGELHAEVVLLRVGGVPQVVGENQEDVHKGGVCRVVLERVALSPRHGVAQQVQGGGAVRDRHAAHVPEYEHPPPLLVEDVPRGWHAVVSLGARVAVEPVGQDHERHGRRDGVGELVLLGRAARRDHEQEDPGHAQLGPHLEVQLREPRYQRYPRVEARPHEDVVERVAGRALLVLGHPLAPGPQPDRDEVPGEQGPGADAAEVVCPRGELHGTGELQDQEAYDRAVPHANAVAHVLQRHAAKAGQRQAFHLDAWHDHREHSGVNDEAEVQAEALPRGLRIVHPRAKDAVSPVLEALVLVPAQVHVIVCGQQQGIHHHM
mmetsp:Transcript_20786/g.70756  ORF Transcript_20786/g.70756 Transcript_20786/m.70756 type:complete len:499 (+) Transcript_20786:1301-2797(+)